MDWFACLRSRVVRRTLLTIEPLEDRTLLSGDLLAVTQVPGTNFYNLTEYTPQGVQVSSQSVPQAPGATEYEDARGLSVDPTGNVNIYDGTFTPSLATYSPAAQSWSFQTLSGWSTVNNISYGEVAAYKNYVFASDMSTYGDTQQPLNGIVRFNTTDQSATRFAQGTDFIQVSLGLDGQLYGLSYSGNVQVFNPDTLAPVRTLTLTGGPDSDIRSIAIDGSGNIYAAAWGGTVAKYDSSGNYTGTSVQLNVPGFGFGENLINIALDTDGQIAVGGSSGEIYLTNESLTNVQTIQTNQWTTFVTFDHYIGTAPQAVTPSFSNLAGPTITYGQSSVMLGGTISAGSTYPPGSANITLNGVTQAAAINPTDGCFSATFSTDGLPAGSYTIQYNYAGNPNFQAISGTRTLQVTYAVTSLSDTSKPVQAGAALPIMLQVSDALGDNLSSPDLSVTAISLVGPDGQTYTPQAKGDANPDNVFRNVGFGYLYNLDTTGLAPGTYTLLVKVGDDPVLHAFSFVVD